MKNLLILGILILNIYSVNAQVNLPYSSAKTFKTGTLTYKNLYDGMHHPSLSVNRFLNNESNGYGLSQLIDRVVSGAEDLTQFEDGLGAIIGFVSDGDDLTKEKRNNQARMLENQAYVLLVSYTMLQNGLQAHLPAALSESAIGLLLPRFKTNLSQSNSWYVPNGGDMVESTQAMMNYARAIDLALGLEIVFNYHASGNNTNATTMHLFTVTEKDAIMANLKQVINNGYNALHNDDVLDVVDALLVLEDIDMKDFESGNRPMKMYMAVAYSMMTYQFKEGTSNSTTKNNYLNQFIEAINAIDYNKEDNSRGSYWGYQSINGSKNWAEGPHYLDFLLKEALPFWHAYRINMSSFPSPYQTKNAFNDDDFFNPILWMTDITMPNGRMPSIDDGNYRSFGKLLYMNWSSTYAPYSTAQKISKRAQHWIQKLPPPLSKV